MSSETRPRVQYVIVHTPGRAWAKGVDFREQNGVQEHVEHYRQVHEAGKLHLGGPFLTPDSGGMMIPIQGLSEDEVRWMAESDPAVKRGLLNAEVRPWYVAMSQKA